MDTQYLIPVAPFLIPDRQMLKKKHYLNRCQETFFLPLRNLIKSNLFKIVNKPFKHCKKLFKLVLKATQILKQFFKQISKQFYFNYNLFQNCKQILFCMKQFQAITITILKKKNLDRQFQTSCKISGSILYKQQLTYQNNYQIDGQLQTIQVFSEQSKTISVQFF